MAICTATQVKNYIKNYNTTDIADADIDLMIKDAYGLINVLSRYDWYTAVVSDLSDASEFTINKVVIDLVCIQMVTYDMSTFTTRTEAEDMINVYRDSALRGLAMLRDQKVVRFLIDAT